MENRDGLRRIEAMVNLDICRQRDLKYEGFSGKKKGKENST